MLDQLVESTDNSKQGKIRNTLLLLTLLLVFSGFVSALGVSLFNQSFLVGGDGLELSTLVAPPIPEEAPPPPEPEPDQPKKQQQQDDNQPKVATRTELIARLDMSPKIPDKVSVQRNNVPPVPKSGMVTVGSSNTDVAPGAATGPARPGSGGPITPSAPKAPEPPKPEPPKPAAPPPPPPPPPPPAVPKRISKGVVNGSAISLPKPAYPPSAKAVNAKGSVSVAIVISKDGSVMSANAVSGHPLLRAAAVSAARGARFRPTLLSGQPVEVSGVIVYNFQ
ncbi:MAG: TonB family protein [Pyrinomonadaceae bacterium]